MSVPILYFVGPSRSNGKERERDLPLPSTSNSAIRSFINYYQYCTVVEYTLHWKRTEIASINTIVVVVKIEAGTTWPSTNVMVVDDNSSKELTPRRLDLIPTRTSIHKYFVLLFCNGWIEELAQ